MNLALAVQSASSRMLINNEESEWWSVDIKLLRKFSQNSYYLH